ncbi:hypothetical protein BCM0060_3406 [Bacillus cereus]|nr:hypothetical protein CR195_005160 [Bacillus cereus]BCC07143.1 hypothetical protein BCM0060_3406 [Bacillus cereus]HDR4410111.1 hypothetical protein [Bacillus cereus]
MTSSNNKAASIYEGTNVNAGGSFVSIEETKIFNPIQIGSWPLRNRIAMAPMTRCFADNETGAVGADVAAFGRPLIANPDFVHRIKSAESLVEYDAKEHLATLI